MKVIHIPLLHTNITVLPKLFISKNVTYTGYYYFTDKSKYIIHDQDQYDWNKVTGLAPLFTSLSNKGMSNKIMAVWRYDPNEDIFHTGLYFHTLSGARSMPEDNGSLLKIKPHQKVLFTFSSTYKKPLQASLYTSTNPTPKIITAYNTKGSIITRTTIPFFGGNKKPPKPLSFHMKQTKYLKNTYIPL